MNNRIEQEINKTLKCLDNDIDIQVNSLFAENINSRISNIKNSRGVGYQTHIFYSLVITLFVILNLATILTNFKKQTSVDDTANNQIALLANEYGIGQNNFSNF